MDTNTSENKSVEILVFYIGKTLYGLRMERVEEIIGIQKIIPLPGSMDEILGIINLRNRIIPIVDSNFLLKEASASSLEEEEKNQGIVIVSFAGERVGIIVDDMCDVLSVHSEQFVSLSKKNEKNRYLKNFVRTKNDSGEDAANQLISMLDLEEMLTFGENV